MDRVSPRFHSLHRPIKPQSNGFRSLIPTQLIHYHAHIQKNPIIKQNNPPFQNPQIVVTNQMQEQAASSIPANSLPSSSDRSSSSALQHEVKEGMESDEEIRRVPEMSSGEPAGASVSCRGAAGPDRAQGQSQRKRGRSPADKENKRLKRLLRNRVSAQQARERKKAYMSELEARTSELEKKNSELEEKLSTLQNENQMLRHILKNTTASRRGGGGGNANGDGSV